MGKRKSLSRSGELTNINPALVPTAAFSAVPRTPPPQPQPITGLGGSQEVLNASLLGRQPVPDQGQDDEPFSDPESSLYDFQVMEDAGYSSVEMLAAPGHRRSMSDRPPVHTPPSRRREHDIEEQETQNTAGRRKRDSIEDPAALYAKPIKKSEQVMSTTSLRGTAGDVRAAMRAVQAMDSDDDMAEQAAHKPTSARSIHFPAEQHETSLKDHVSRESIIEEPQIIQKRSTPITSSAPKPRRTEELSMSALTLESPIVPDSAVPVSSRSRPSTARSITVSEDKMMSLEAEKSHLTHLITQLEQEVMSYKEVVATYNTDVHSGQTMLLQKDNNDLKEENESMKTSIHRLNVELSSYQARYRPVTEEQMGDVMGLPSKGPLPSWLLNIRYLNPLFLAYDDRLREREETINRCQLELETLRVRAEEIIKENEKLHLRLEQSGKQGPVDVTEWEQLKENARLVLEENQNLLEQINIKDQKSQDLHQAHVREVSKLSKQMVLLKAEKTETEQQLEEVQQKYRDIKQKYDNLVLNTQNQITTEKHIEDITQLKISFSEKEETHRKEVVDSNSKYQALQVERKTLTSQVVDLSADNKRLQVEVKMLNKTVRKLQDKMRKLLHAIEDSENKEMSVQDYLSSVIKVAEKNKFERDTYAKVAKEQEMETKKAMHKLLHGNLTMGKMEEKLKLYKMKAAAKISTVADRLKQQDEVFNNQKKEYEREIAHLRFLLNEKEGWLESAAKDKRHVEGELEAMWQAANTENAMIREQMQRSIAKLRKHTGLSAAIDEHDRLGPCYLSSDEEAVS